jgi:hypothetical protein
MTWYPYSSLHRTCPEPDLADLKVPAIFWKNFLSEEAVSFY